MSEDEIQRIWDDGNHVMSIQYYNNKISLYSVGLEFFEVIYNPNSNEIEKIKPVDSEDLKKFLNRIKIEF